MTNEIKTRCQTTQKTKKNVPTLKIMTYKIQNGSIVNYIIIRYQIQTFGHLIRN